MSTSVVTNADEMEKVNAQISIWTGSKWLELANQKTVNTINSNVATVSSAVEEVQANITTVETNVDSAMTTADNSLTVAQTAISNAQTASDTANNATTVANNAISQATSASTVANNVSEEITTLKGGSTATIAELEDGLALKLSTSDFDTQIANYATQTWTTNQITATASSLSSTIASVQTQVNNSAVGTNLLTGTSNTTNTTLSGSGWQAASSGVISQKLQPNTTYTYSVNMVSASYTWYLECQEFDDKGNWLRNSGGTPGDTSTGAQSITFTTGQDATSYAVHVVLQNPSTTQTLVWNSEKLELGSHATDYSANPADNATVTSVSNLMQTVDSLSTVVSGKVDNTTYTSKVTELANSIATKVSQDDYDTEITQLSTAIDAKVSSDDYNTEVTLLSNQISAKVSQSDYDSKITQLSTDINLKVSQGDVISQINAEADNILIQSSKLYLDADSVVFGGTAFITEAMISSVNADTITTGIATGNEMKLDFTNGTINVNDTFEVDASGNVTANSLTMTGGVISGTDLEINVTTGKVSFQSGAISSTDSTFLIDIDNKTITSTNTDSDSDVSQATLEAGHLTASYYDSSTSLTETTSIQNGAVTSTQLNGSIVQYYTNLSATALEFGLNSSTTTNHGVSEYLTIAVTDKAPAITSANTFDLITAGTTTINSGGEIDINAPKANKIGFTVPGVAGLYLNGDSAITMAAPSSNVYINSGGFVVNENANIKGWLGAGSLSVSGSKNAVVKTTAGWTKINAYETADYYFGDIAKANTGSGSKVKIEMDSLFLETVNTGVDYHVFLSSYGNGYAWVSEQAETYFVIESNVPSLDVSYEVKAKRLGYEDVRLEIDENFGKQIA